MVGTLKGNNKQVMDKVSPVFLDDFKSHNFKQGHCIFHWKYYFYHAGSLFIYFWFL